GIVRGRRLHALPAAPWRVERGDPIVHGAPPGDEPPFLCLCAFGATDAKALRVRPALSSDIAAAPGAHSQSDVLPFASDRTFRSPRGRRGSRIACSRADYPGHGDSGSAAAVERTLPCDGH